jgi:uncharacterized protein
VADGLAFDWDIANVAHIARHRVTSDEVEQVFANDPIGLSAEVINGEQRYTRVGHTNLLRVLVVAWTMRGETIRPITTFKASRKLVRRYLALRGF